jgi:RNA-binding protein
MLTGKQRSYLKKLAQELDAGVFIGKAGLTDNIIKEMDNYLEANELLKVKIQEGSELDPKETANSLLETLNAEFVQAIGRKFTLYRQAKKKEDRKIILPRPGK